MCADCQLRFLAAYPADQPCQLEVTYRSGKQETLSFATAFVRGLYVIALAAQPVTVRLLGVLLAVFVIAAPAAAQTAERPTGSDPIYRAGQAAVVVANLGDVATTLSGWSRGHRETNPLIGGNSVGRLIAVKSVTVVAQLALMHWLAKSGHPKAAGFVGLGSSMPPTLAAWHNARLHGARR